MNKGVYWLLILSVPYSLAYSKFPERMYTHPRFFLWTSFVYQAYVVIMILCTGKIESDLHWLFLLPILFMASYYGMKEGLHSAIISCILLTAIYLFAAPELGDVSFLHIWGRRVSVLIGTALFMGLFANEQISERK